MNDLERILQAWAEEILKFYRPGTVIPLTKEQFRRIRDAAAQEIR